jgi:hypothetical protein
LKSIDTFDEAAKKAKWANINSQIKKALAKYNEDDEVDLVLRVKNKYTTSNYTFDEIPESLEELLNEFPESVDLEYQLIENGTDVKTHQFLKKFEDVKEETDNSIITTKENIPIEQNKSLQPEKSNSNSTVNPQTQNPIDITGIMAQVAMITESMNRRLDESNQRLEKYFFANKEETKPQIQEYNKSYVDALLQQISDLKDLSKELKEELRELRNQNFTLQIENVKLSSLASQNINPQVVEQKIEDSIKAYERNQKKFQEQFEERRKELDKINEEIIEAKIKSKIDPNNLSNTELDKAMADVIRNKVPTLIDKGFDLVFPLNTINGSQKTSAPPALI